MYHKRRRLHHVVLVCHVISRPNLISNSAFRDWTLHSCTGYSKLSHGYGGTIFRSTHCRCVFWIKQRRVDRNLSTAESHELDQHTPSRTLIKGKCSSGFDANILISFQLHLPTWKTKTVSNLSLCCVHTAVVRGCHCSKEMPELLSVLINHWKQWLAAVFGVEFWNAGELQVQVEFSTFQVSAINDSLSSLNLKFEFSKFVSNLKLEWTFNFQLSNFETWFWISNFEFPLPSQSLGGLA